MCVEIKKRKKGKRFRNKLFQFRFVSETKQKRYFRVKFCPRVVSYIIVFVYAFALTGY